ncbi:MAG: hypothetical protein GC178_02655 [Flavobacteriales bacterium]|nr:hypothetical protein [Flavobacteriales bacterium]
MKKGLLLILAFVPFLGLPGCKVLDELRTFHINYSADFTIPSTSIIDIPVSLPTPSTTTNSEQKFEDEGVKSDWIDSIKLTSLSITITSPQGEDFSFLQEISIYMKTDGQPEVLIASKIPVPSDAGSTLTLDVTGTDLYPYISQSSFTLRTAATTDETMTQSVDFRADMVVEVKATIPGGKK